MRQMDWLERSFDFSFPVGIFPGLVERLRGTPFRIKNLTLDLPQEVLTYSPDGGWSIQEHTGHLFDLEELWKCRLDEVLNMKDVLTAADMKNRKTHEAGYNEKPFKEIFMSFSSERRGLVDRLDALSESEAGLKAFHPRLKKPMRVVDLVFFAAEHDDHHLARIRETIKELL